ncbi:MAG: S-layer homology domain-containing protein [Oscillospiraceae bacterium]|nr:S-layer homology domain-containing protein [Oscillospiraceae bacterium]
MSALKRVLSLILVIVLLVSLSAALSAGTAEDPLISLSYLKGQYTSSLLSQAKEEFSKSSSALLAEAGERFSRATEGYMLGAPESEFSSGYNILNFNAGDELTLYSGASAVIIGGAALVSVKSGELIDVSRGAVVSVSDSANPSARMVKNGVRYFAAEESSAVFTCYVSGSIAVDGFYNLSRGGGSAPGLLFTDVSGSYWAADYIYALADRKLVNGMGGSTFEPLTTMTRAMFVTVLGRLDNIKVSSYSSNSFSDVPSDAWYAPYVSWASEKGIVTGYDDGAFRPNDPITREQMAVIIVRYIDFAGLSLQEKNEAAEFPDAGLISPWASDAVGRAQRLGLITGRDSGAFDPKGTANRAEVCTVLYRLISQM